MPNQAKKLSPAGRELRGALTIYLAPRLAADAKLPDIGAILRSAPTSSRIMQTTAIAAALKASVGSILAKDADIDDVVDVIEAAERVIDQAREADGEDGLEENAAVPMGETDEDDDAEDETPEERAERERMEREKGGNDDDHPLVAKVRAFCDGKMSPEDCAKLDELLGEELRAHDEETEGKMPKNAITKEAMDSAIAAALVANDEKHRGIAAARAKVQPLVGSITAACDSAATVFRKALDVRGIAHKSVPDVGVEPLWDAVAALPQRQAVRASDAALPSGVPAPEDFFARPAAA